MSTPKLRNSCECEGLEARYCDLAIIYLPSQRNNEAAFSSVDIPASSVTYAPCGMWAQM